MSNIYYEITGRSVRHKGCWFEAFLTETKDEEEAEHFSSWALKLLGESPLQSFLVELTQRTKHSIAEKLVTESTPMHCNAPFVDLWVCSRVLEQKALKNAPAHSSKPSRWFNADDNWRMSEHQRQSILTESVWGFSYWDVEAHMIQGSWLRALKSGNIARYEHIPQLKAQSWAHIDSSIKQRATRNPTNSPANSPAYRTAPFTLNCRIRYAQLCFLISPCMS